MQKFNYYLNKYKFILILIIILISIVASIVYALPKGVEKNSIDVDVIESKEPEINVEIEENKVKVDVKGYVNNPGVYELDANSRVIDAIDLAGGLRDDASTEYINLGKKIKDEMIIIVYSNKEIEKFKKTDKQIIYIERECNCPDNINDACIKNSDVINISNEEKKDSTSNANTISGKISINNATLEELMSLTGIGESKAKAIIEYRETNGSFSSLEDIMNVSGIGDTVYSKIKDNIEL